jgi:hypothetical protein
MCAAGARPRRARAPPRSRVCVATQGMRASPQSGVRISAGHPRLARLAAGGCARPRRSRVQGARRADRGGVQDVACGDRLRRGTPAVVASGASACRCVLWRLALRGRHSRLMPPRPVLGTRVPHPL